MIKLTPIIIEGIENNHNAISQLVGQVSAKLGMPLYGNESIVDYVAKPSGEYLGIKYNVGTSERALRFDIPANSDAITRIDFWFYASSNPQTTMIVDPTVDLELMVDPIVAYIRTGNPEQYILPGEELMSETKNIPFDLQGFMKYVNQKTPIYTWIKEQSVRDKNLAFLLAHSKMTPLFTSYQNWAKKAKMKTYSYPGFRNVIVTAYKDSRMKIVKKVEIESAENESIKANLEKEKLMKEIAKYRLTPNEIFSQIEGYVGAVASNHAYSLIVSGDPGIGKAQPLTEPVLTPTGWTMMGEIKVGDKIIAQDGKPANVMEIFPQGEREKYKIEFTDETFTYCDGDHLWTVIDDNAWKRLKNWKVKTTKELMANLTFPSSRLKWRIPVVQPVEYGTTNQILPIEPYLLGALLGDGSFRGNAIKFTCAEQELVTLVEEKMPEYAVLNHNESQVRGSTSGFHIVEKISKRLIDNKSESGFYYNQFKKHISSMNLLETKSETKFIPSEYKIASIDDRTSLLRGLMDTDGYVNKNGTVQYSTASEVLANDIVELVNSLGGTVLRSSKTPRFTYNNEYKTGQLAYILTIQMPFDINPFKLKRKAILFTKHRCEPTRKIKSITKCNEMVEMQCISVDHPTETYITRNFIVTHNTFSITKKLQQLGYSRKVQEVEYDEDGKFVMPSLHGKEYITMSGTITPMGCYTLMYAYNGALLVFDDCDSLFDSEDGLNLIKGATDDKKIRNIGMRSARTTGKKSMVPPSFDFVGKVIFITNKYLKDIDTAVKSRALIVEVDLTPEQAAERIKKIMPQLCKDLPDATMPLKNEVLNYLLSIKNLYKKLDFRTYEQAVKERLRGSPIWKKLIARSVLAKQGYSV